jgi:predicted ester cyclase
MVAEGEEICVRWTATLTHTGDYFGLPPSGKKATITGMNTWVTANGKAIEGWVNRDDMGLLQQLGVIPTQ